MLVKDCMTRHPIMVPPTTSATEAQQILAQNFIRHLPVVGDGKRLQGLITRQRLKLDPEALGSLNVWEITRYINQVTVKKLMIPLKQVHTINQEASIEQAADLLAEKKIGCLPVLEEKDIIVGIITEIDLLNAFKEMLGLPSEGVRVTVRMPNQPGEFNRLMSVLVEHNWCVMGIGTYPSPRREGFYDTVVKISQVPISDVKSILGRVPDMEITDIREVA